MYIVCGHTDGNFEHNNLTKANIVSNRPNYYPHFNLVELNREWTKPWASEKSTTKAATLRLHIGNKWDYIAKDDVVPITKQATEMKKENFKEKKRIKERTWRAV